MAINIGKKNFKAQGTDTKDYVNYMVGKRLGEIDAHMAGTDKKHAAKDIVCADDWVDGENIQEAIDYLGEEKERIHALAHSNKTRLDNVEPRVTNNETKLQNLQELVATYNEHSLERDEAHTTDIENLAQLVQENDIASQNRDEDAQNAIAELREEIINDLVTRPTAEWSEEVVNDLINKEERVSALEKLTSESLPDLDAQIQGNKASIEVLGVDMYSMGQTSKQIFANALKGSATGEAIALKDTSPVEHIMDVKVRKKNLIAYPYRDLPEGAGIKEVSGVTITIDEKGAITINGTSTDNLTFYLFNPLFPEGVKVGDKITCSKNASDSTQGKGVIFVCNYRKPISGQIQGTSSIADFFTTTIKEGAVGFNVYLYIQKDKVFDNLIIKPQIELGDKATGWSPYLAEDISTVKLNALGKNLFNIGNVKTTNATPPHGKITEIGDNYFIATTEEYETLANGYTQFDRTLSQLCPDLVIGKTYTLSAESESVNKYFYINGLSIRWDFGKALTITEEILNSRISCYGFSSQDGQGTGDCKISNVMIELGDIATEYEPYKEPVEYTVNEDGTVTDVVSMYPNMTLLADANGAVIDVEYNRDINKAFAELANAIVALGGTI